ncbi:MFS transporter [Fictibacillus barbaricus]|uniref:MFS transporter n=1 Tax=Fictibacillus barbaricus TaxID=182136 RepID=A0ABS2ZCS2_9BACL|nr:MFS transporter [Fictibacillus barbaricus]MBN3545487.1 MFS transporter [Fictibacillus barbaricus]GGB53802.1 MFS transporter [Fictibacillus barbaricus]
MSQPIATIGERTTKKVFWRIIPFIFLLYIVAFLDRVNLGYAALDMNKDLALASSTFGLISGIFFFGYFLFEIPSNILLHKIGARKWIARIMVSWGIVVILTAWAQSATHLYILRFLLGVAEAGFFPGVILYITYWFRAKEQARAFALFMTALAASNIIGAPLSTWIMDTISWAGMPGWRWMFILEGIPAIIIGIITYYYLTDRPQEAKWLTKEEKEWLIQEIRHENEQKVGSKHHSARDVLTNPQVWRLSFIYLTLVIGLYGIGFWMPTIIKSFSSILTNTQVGLITMIPYIAAGICMILWARRSDRSGERRMHTALPPLLGALGLIGAGMTTNPYLSVIMMSIATIGIYSFFGPFWSLPAFFLTEVSAAVGIALINSIGNLGGFVGPYMIGYLNELTGNMEAGLYFLSFSLIITSLLVLSIKKQISVVKTDAPLVKTKSS